MTTQYIVKYSNKDDTDLDVFVELIKTNYDIPILSVRTHDNKNDKMNQILLHQFITNNFAQVSYNDEKMACVMTYPNNILVFKFDNHSSSAFTEFKNNLSTLLNSKFETEYYKSGRVMYVGEVLYLKEDEVVKERRPEGNGVIYYDIPNHRIKYTGEFVKGLPDGAGIFYNNVGNISLKANNITKGIPTQKGKLEVNFRSNKQVINITFSELWKQFEIMNDTIKEIFVMSDEFLDILAKKLCNYENLTFEELCFDEKISDDKLVEVWKLLNIVKRENDSHHEIIKLINYRQNKMSKMLIGIICLLFINIIINVVK